MTTRVGAIEVLLTVDDSDAGRAEKNVRATGERIEKKPIVAKVDGDATGALDMMDKVETEAKKLVSERAVLKVEADIERAEKNLDRAKNRLEDLAVRAEGGIDVTADVRRAEQQVQRLETQIERLRTARSNIEIEADPAQALAALQEVDREAKQLVSRDVALRVNANVANAERAVADIRSEIDYLQSLSPTVDVTADVAQAEARLAGAEAALKDLQGARATMIVDVNEGGAKQKLQDVADFAEDAGEDGGRRGGAGLLTGIVAGLASIPVAGAVVSIGQAIGDQLVDSFNDALQVEVRQDRLQALTGITEDDAARFARAAGEAYANGFGESIESNMNTSRLALQFNLIDGDATARESQKVVEGLAGIADVLEEDVQPTATAVATLLRTGMAASAKEAYDLLAAGAREGLNRNEDLLDTLTEYPVVLRRLGLTGEEMLGLINQGLEAGARNTDVAADALKEFQIRATDGSESSARGFERLGLSAEEMTAKIAAGGDSAREGLQQTLDGLRAIEDPVIRNAAAVELFGTKAEDLGDALFAMDLSTAVDSLNGVAGAAEAMYNTLADNDASRVERARRNIEVAAQGIQGALASAFADPLGDAADWIASNRGPMLQFFLDLANGALDFGESMLESAASGTEAFGEFVSGPLADAAEGLASLMRWLGQNDAADGIQEMVDGMREFEDSTSTTADTMREQVGGALDAARDKLNQFGEPAVAMGYLNDASLRLAGAIDEIGYAADGSQISLNGIELANLGATEAGRQLESQVRNAIAALSDEIYAADMAGESQEQLAGRYNTATSALVGQLTQMGLTEEQARSLIDTVLQTPESATTAFSSNAPSEQGRVQSLADRITTLPDGSVVVRADTSPAQNSVEDFIRRNAGRRFNMYIDAINSGGGGGRGMAQQAMGGVLEFMAAGGIPGLSPMQSVAQMVPANTWRVVGDRGDVPEAYVPLDGSARSWAILMEALRRMPGGPDEGLAGAPSPSGPGPSTMPPIQVIHNGDNYAYDPRDIAREQKLGLTRALDSLPPTQ
jgi:phage-related minor tail protein